MTEMTKHLGNAGDLYAVQQQTYCTTVELDLTLAPPAWVVCAPGQDSANVWSLALNAIDNGIGLFGGQRVFAAELGMEISNISWHIGEGVVDQVVVDQIIVMRFILFLSPAEAFFHTLQNAPPLAPPHPHI